LAVASDD
jgi:hypothetical protein